MCGRYASSRKPEELVQEFGVEQVATTETLRPDYNVAPTRKVYAVLVRPPDGSQDPVRQLRVVNWGLVPSWASDQGVASRLINARMETVAHKPAYRRSFATRRCLLPADGYFEWHAGEGATHGQHQGRRKQGRRKQPYFVRPRDGGVLAMAGVYALWRDPVRDAEDPRRWLWTAALITTAAEEGIDWLHDRMPLLVPPERYDAWLDPEVTDGDAARRLLVPAPPGRLEAYPVSTAVNSVANNGPRLTDPVPPEEGAGAGLF